MANCASCKHIDQTHLLSDPSIPPYACKLKRFSSILPSNPACEFFERSEGFLKDSGIKDSPFNILKLKNSLPILIFFLGGMLIAPRIGFDEFTGAFLGLFVYIGIRITINSAKKR